MGEMRLMGGSGRLPMIQELLLEPMREHDIEQERMIPDGFTAGDTRVQWNPGNSDEVEAAKTQFDNLTKKGFVAYKVSGKGKKGEQVKKFDPEAGAIIMAPQMSGGSDDDRRRLLHAQIEEWATNASDSGLPIDQTVDAILNQMSQENMRFLAKEKIEDILSAATPA